MKELDKAMTHKTSFKSAFVTGASSGIGRAIAGALAARGTRVVLAARRESELVDARDAIVAAGGRADVCVLDVSDHEAAREAVRRWERDTGGLDLVLANAGVGDTQPAVKIDWPMVERMLGVNLLGALAVIVEAMPAMLGRGHGTLAAVSSLAAMRGLPTSSLYSASKAGVSTFLEALRVELAPRGLSVVDIRPGFVDTAMTRKNRFPMPFLMPLDAAAAVALKGLERGDAVVSFPWQISAAMKLAEKMPDALWRQVARRLPVKPG